MNKILTNKEQAVHKTEIAEVDRIKLVLKPIKNNIDPEVSNPIKTCAIESELASLKLEARREKNRLNSKAWRLRNPDYYRHQGKNKVKHQLWLEKTKDKRKEQMHQWYLRNKDKVLARSKARYQAKKGSKP